jgi:hypothetical protein
MTRALSFYILLLDFFMLIIAIMSFFMLLNHKPITGEGDKLLVGSMFLNSIFSVIYILYTRNTVSGIEYQRDQRVIDDLLPDDKVAPITGGIKFCGVIAGALSAFILGTLVLPFAFTYTDQEPRVHFESNASIILVVIIFNAICQPWYVWKTFNNVKSEK